MCGGFLGKLLSNPVVDVGIGALGMAFAPELAGAMGGLFGGADATAAGLAAVDNITPASVMAGSGWTGGEMAAAAGGAAGGMPTLSLGTFGPAAGVGSGAGWDASTLMSSAGGGGGGQGSSFLSYFTGPGGASNGLGLARTLAGLYGLTQNNKMMQMMKPPNPAALTSMPGYQAGLDAVQRSMAAQGYQGSGNMMTALQKYGGDAYSQMWGNNMQAAQAGMGGLVGSLSSMGLLTSGLGGLAGWGNG